MHVLSRWALRGVRRTWKDYNHENLPRALHLDDALHVHAQHVQCRKARLQAGTAAHEPEGCLCGELLRGLITPFDCPLFGQACTPETPVGPCMVSIEGSCNIEYRYQER